MIRTSSSLVGHGSRLPSAALLVAHTRKLDLHAINAVYAVDEQDKDEDERYLNACEREFNSIV
jgi:hypothetical protein